ncbi:putative protein FAM90A7P [Rattus rattus]|uniref:putative protein FAM90A7P n=1 Tax=Rattus rattus TaxID=10117 RepID=UPI0013F33FE2|nr:putative protein FAM90A7P [Rattus rattus]
MDFSRKGNPSQRVHKMNSKVKTQSNPATPAPTAQRNPGASWKQTIPPVKEEDPRVKCRDCGAFGHIARNRRCPIKRGLFLLVAQLLGAKKEKENTDPCRPKGLQKLSQAARQRCDEQQRNAPFQKFPTELQWRNQQGTLAQPQMSIIPGYRKMSEPPVEMPLGKQTCPEKPALQSLETSCILHSRQKEGQNITVPGVAKPVFAENGRKTATENLLDQKLQDVSHQHPVAVPKRKAIAELFHKESKTQGPSKKMQPRQHPVIHQNRQNTKLSCCAPDEETSQFPTQPSQNPLKKQRIDSTNAPEESHASTGSKSTLDSQSSPIANRLEVKDAAEMSKKIAVQVPSTDQQQLHSRAALVSTRPCIESGQALRMIFTKHSHNFWSSRFLTVPSPLPIEKQTRPFESPAFPEEGEAAGSQVKLSVLYEDLQVSSSSEDSDGE